MKVQPTGFERRSQHRFRGFNGGTDLATLRPQRQMAARARLQSLQFLNDRCVNLWTHMPHVLPAFASKPQFQVMHSSAAFARDKSLLCERIEVGAT
jgi:hypothetical protein